MANMRQEPAPLTLAQLERWELFGGTFAAGAVTDGQAVVELRMCTGELVECRRADDPAVLARLEALRSPLPPSGSMFDPADPNYDGRGPS